MTSTQFLLIGPTQRRVHCWPGSKRESLSRSIARIPFVNRSATSPTAMGSHGGRVASWSLVREGKRGDRAPYPAWTFAWAGSSRTFFGNRGRARPRPLEGTGEGHVGGESARPTESIVR